MKKRNGVSGGARARQDVQLRRMFRHSDQRPPPPRSGAARPGRRRRRTRARRARGSAARRQCTLPAARDFLSCEAACELHDDAGSSRVGLQSGSARLISAAKRSSDLRPFTSAKRSVITQAVTRSQRAMSATHASRRLRPWTVAGAAGRWIPSFFMRNRSVFGCSPSTSAALPLPLMRHPQRRSACSMCRRSTSSRVPPSRDGSTLQARTVIEHQRVTGRMNHRALDHVLELAHVARPRVFLQRGQHRRGNSREPAVQRALAPVDEEPRQPRDVLDPLAQRRSRTIGKTLSR